MSMLLRDYSPSDVDRLVELANNENVSRYLIYTFPFPYTQADAEWWIAVGSKQNGTVTKVIEVDGVFVGSVGTVPQAGWQSHVAEIGYWLGEPFWGRGIASEALRSMTTLAFSSPTFLKLFAPVLAPNRASMRVLEKNQFVLEGVFKADVRKGGLYFDRHVYAKGRPPQTNVSPD